MNRHIQPIIDDLRMQLSQAEAAARINAETIAEQQREIDRLNDLFRQYSLDTGEQFTEQRIQIERLKRGEFICAKCGIRKDSEHNFKAEF